jgi:hypothetical protein
MIISIMYDSTNSSLFIVIKWNNDTDLRMF